jgi:Fe-S cluster assembly protein SufD
MTGIASIRQDAARRFAELGFPTTRDEEWRFTNVSSIAKTQFSAAPSDLNTWEGAQLDPCLSLNEGGLRLVFINGRYSPNLSSVQKLPRGIRATSLREANGAVEAHLARYAAFQDRAFVALNTADFDDGACIEIPKGSRRGADSPRVPRDRRRRAGHFASAQPGRDRTRQPGNRS